MRCAITVAGLLAGCAGAPPPVTTGPPPDDADVTQVLRALPEVDRAPTLPDGVRSLFAWLDERTPRLEDAAFVRAYTGLRVYAGGGERVPETIDGFLVEDDDDLFVVVDGLDPRAFERRRTFHGIEVRYEPIPIAEGLRQAITRARADAESPARDRSLRRERISPRLRALLLARGGLAHGEQALAAELIELALRLEGWSSPIGAGDDPVAGARGDLGISYLAEAIEAATDVDESRHELRERFEFVVEHFEGTEAAAIALEHVTTLDRMIAEDDARGGAPPGPTAAARVADAIHRLRDATYAGPIEELKQMGELAVPALLEILDDRRLTRAEGSGGRMIPVVRRYGEVARHILADIAGRYFRRTEDARRWWAEVQRRGREEVLADDVRAGGFGATSALERLLAVDERRGLREGIAAARGADDALRARLVRVLARHEGSGPVRFLLEETRTGPLASRVAAAEGLRERGDGRWIEPLATELRRRIDLSQQAGSEQGSDHHEEFAVRRLLSMLLEGGGPTGAETVGRLYPSLDPDVRVDVLSTLAHVRPSDPTASARVEEILASALTDDSRPTDRFGPGRRCGFPTVGDTAADLLAERVGARYDCRAAPWERDRQRLELANRFRDARAEPPLELPAAPTRPTVEASRGAAARLALASARGEDDRRAALARFAELGLGGIAPLRAAIDELEDGHPSVAPATATLARLASIVREVRIDDALPVADRARLAALTGRPLAARDVARVAAETFAAHPRGALRIAVHRDGGGLGVTLSIETREHSPESDHDGLDYAYLARQGDDVLAADHVDSDNLRGFGLGAWAPVSLRLTTILEAPADVDGEVALQATWNR